jgi:hypothetical protein
MAFCVPAIFSVFGLCLLLLPASATTLRSCSGPCSSAIFASQIASFQKNTNLFVTFGSTISYLHSVSA